MQLAERLSKVTPSLTLAIDAKAKSLKAQGVDVVLFTVGEPDFDTPEHVREAAKQALDKGKTKYGAVAGELPLRESIAAKLKRENGLEYKAEQIIVSNGGKHSIFNVVLALCGPGDDVVIPSPYWLSYPEMARLAGANPVIVKTDASTHYKMTPEQLEASITPRTRLLILNSPSNPTGAVYSRAELEKLAEVIVRKNIMVLSDEIYEKLLYGKAEHCSIASLGKEIFDRTIVCNGFAKAYAMTGWRLGYVAATTEIVKALTNLQSHSTSNVCSFAQYGAIAALEGPQQPLEEMRKVFETRREEMIKLARAIPGISFAAPDGAFYLYLNISKTGLSSLDFCTALLETENVAGVPGSCFGDDDHVRLSYATDMNSIRKGMERIARFVASRLKS